MKPQKYLKTDIRWDDKNHIMMYDGGQHRISPSQWNRHLALPASNNGQYK